MPMKRRAEWCAAAVMLLTALAGFLPSPGG